MFTAHCSLCSRTVIFVKQGEGEWVIIAVVPVTLVSQRRCVLVHHWQFPSCESLCTLVQLFPPNYLFQHQQWHSHIETQRHKETDLWERHIQSQTFSSSSSSSSTEREIERHTQTQVTGGLVTMSESDTQDQSKKLLEWHWKGSKSDIWTAKWIKATLAKAGEGKGKMGNRRQWPKSKPVSFGLLSSILCAIAAIFTVVRCNQRHLTRTMRTDWRDDKSKYSLHVTCFPVTINDNLLTLSLSLSLSQCNAMRAFAMSPALSLLVSLVPIAIKPVQMAFFPLSLTRCAERPFIYQLVPESEREKKKKKEKVSGWQVEGASEEKWLWVHFSDNSTHGTGRKERDPAKKLLVCVCVCSLIDLLAGLESNSPSLPPSFSPPLVATRELF